jgi:hypothetical protein
MARRTKKCPACAGKIAGIGLTFLDLYASLADQWDCERNPLQMDAISASAGTSPAHWRCLINRRHLWVTAPVQMMRTQGSGCPYCSGRKVLPEDSLATLRPHIAAQWDIEANRSSPTDVSVGSAKRVAWKCTKDPDHRWRGQVVERASTQGHCPYCIALKVTHPDLWSQLTRTDPGIDWDLLRPKSNLIVEWQCPNDPEHIWKARVFSRLNGNGCSLCTIPKRSKIENYIFQQLRMRLDRPVEREERDARMFAGYHVDMFLPVDKLIVEFDGAYWHRLRPGADARKTRHLIANGWQVLRLRQRPLPRIAVGRHLSVQYTHLGDATSLELMMDQIVKKIESIVD